MRETYQNILNIIVIIFILGSSILLYSQQKFLSQLKNAPTGEGNAAQIDRDQKTSEATVKFVSGRLVGLSGSTLTVEAELPDWEKMKEPRTDSNSTLTSKKTYTVTVDDKTQFSANKLDALKVGDTIGVASKELIYETNKLTAVLIMSPSSLPTQ